jgi:acyl-CoA reductase-like NAD-dependent aldehyde dehydrogenase
MTQLRKSAFTASNAMAVNNPFNGETVGEIAISSAADITAAMLRAKKLQQEFRHSTPAVRRALLTTLAAEIAADAETLAHIISSEMGKTIREARNEVRRAQNTLKLSGDAATFLDGEVLHCGIVEGGADRFATITYEPVGVVGAITPFNYPLNLLCHKLGPAIAAGNAVVAKPSPKAPLAANRLAELAEKAGWPRGLFQIVNGGADTARALARAPIDLLSFTGGPVAGLALKSASGLVRCLMELGGNDPLFVLPDATSTTQWPPPLRIVSRSPAKAALPQSDCTFTETSKDVHQQASRRRRCRQIRRPRQGRHRHGPSYRYVGSKDH